MSTSTPPVFRLPTVDRARLTALRWRLDRQPPGIALDIDGTVADTVGAYFALMHRQFGDPQSLGPGALQKTFRWVENVPYWQHEQAAAFFDKQRSDPSWQAGAAPLAGAVDGVRELGEILPIRLYVTARPVNMIPSSYEWLAEHGFPSAPILACPDRIPHELAGAWKAAVLERLYPAVRGIVEDNASILDHLRPDYAGAVILIAHTTPTRNPADPRVHDVIHWKQIPGVVRSLLATPAVPSNAVKGIELP